MKQLLGLCSKQIVSTVKQPTKINELNYLMSKIKHEKRDRIQFLEQLAQEGSIENYFQEKTIQQLETEDIYFYLSRRAIFTVPPHFARKQIVKNDNLDPYAKFFTAKELGTLYDPNSQKHLVQSFNESCHDLTHQEFLYCLEKIASFIQPQELIDFNVVWDRIQSLVGKDYIEAIYYMHKILDDIEIDFKKLDETLDTEVFKGKHLYFLKSIFVESKIEQTKIDTLVRSLILSSGNESSQYVVQLLEFYPQFTHSIKIDRLTAKQYLKYLSIFEEPTSFHTIPKSVIDDCSSAEFKKICERRVELEMDTVQSLSRRIEDFYTTGLHCIEGLLHFLQEKQVEDAAVWMSVEDSIITHLKIGNENMQVHALDIYDNLSIFRIIGFLAMKKEGSLAFWKAAYGFVYRFLQNSRKIKEMDPKDQKNFIIYLYQIFTYKIPNDTMAEKIRQLTLLAFTIHKWKLKELLPLTISLMVNKIGDHEVWLGLERKILSMNLELIQDEVTRDKLLKILQNFSIMGRGSYRFWGQIRSHLTTIERQFLLSYLKNQNGLAYSYLKL